MSNLLKIIAAFAAGVVVALGGALLYVRTSEMLHPPPVVQPVSANEQLAQAPAPPPPAVQPAAEQASAPPTATPAPAEKPAQPVHKAIKKHTTIATPVRDTVEPVRTSRPAAPHDEPIQIAQNTPLPQNTPAAVGPASSDNNQFSLPQPPPPIESGQQQLQESPAPAAPARQPHTVVLPAGTVFNVRLGETLSTDHNYTGDTFRGTLETPIIMDGFIIADKGSRVLGRIVNAQKAGHLEGVADLNLTLTQINTTDGQRVTVQTNSNDRKGPSNGGQDTAKIAGGAALGAIIGAIAGGGKGAAIGAGAGGAAGTGAVMMTHTKACVIPTESRLSFRLAAPVTLTEKLNF